MTSPETESMLVETPEQLRTIADPFRQQLLQAFAHPATIREVADRLKQPVTKLYHHVDQLVAGQFLKVVSEQRRRALMERTYRVTAHRIEVSPSALGIGARAGSSDREGIVRAAAADIVATASAERGSTRLVRTSARLSAKSIHELETLVSQFIGDHDDSAQPTISLLLITARQAANSENEKATS